MSIRLRKKKATKINVCFVGPDYTIVVKLMYQPN
jgi:hypothetical protein